MLPCGVLIDKIAGQYPPVIISRLQRISDSASATSAAIRNANPLQRPDFRSSESIRPGNSGEPRAISVLSVKRRLPFNVRQSDLRKVEAGIPHQRPVAVDPKIASFRPIGKKLRQDSSIFWSEWRQLSG